MRRDRAMWVLVVAVGCSRGRPAVEGPPDLAILYAADLRGAVATPTHDAGGLARRATWVDRARLSAAAVLQVDAGDLAPAESDGPGMDDPAARAARARLALRAYRRMGVDAITVGERDLALGAANWRAWCNEARVPVVAANVLAPSGEPLFAAGKVVRAGGVPVGIFGLLDLSGGHGPPPSDVRIADPLTAARDAVRSLRAQGARVIVGLFHVAGGLPRIREIAAAAGGVDVVVVGHGGAAAPPAVVRSGVAGVDVGRVDLRLAAAGAPRLTDRRMATSPDVPEQLGVRLLMRLAAAPVPATLAESVAALSKAAGARTYGENWTYGSSPLCLGCHPTQAAQWKTTDHARAFATVQRAGHARDPACLGCHLTGFLLPGGAQNLQTATQFADVGCESCHGPSVSHVVSTDKRRGTSRAVDPIVCLGCHTPDQNVGDFVVAAAMNDVLGPGHGAARRAATAPSP